MYLFDMTYPRTHLVGPGDTRCPVYSFGVRRASLWRADHGTVFDLQNDSTRLAYVLVKCLDASATGWG